MGKVIEYTFAIKQALRTQDWERWLTLLAQQEGAWLEAHDLLPEVEYVEWDARTMIVTGHICYSDGTHDTIVDLRAELLD